MLRGFGPPADAFGHELARLPPFATRNIRRVLDAASWKKERHEQRTSEVSPRLFKKVFDEAIFSEDEIVASYLGGVLATSTAAEASDRGVAIAALIGRLSAVQLRAHYMIYREISSRLVGEEIDLLDPEDRNALHVDVNLSEFCLLLGHRLPGDPDGGYEELLSHIVAGLVRENLVDPDHAGFGLQPVYKRPEVGVPSGPLLVWFHPSAFGAEVYLWGNGATTTNPGKLFDPGLEIIDEEDVPRFAADGVRIARSGLIELSASRALGRRDLAAFSDEAERLVQVLPNSQASHFLKSVSLALSGSAVEALEHMRQSRERSSEEQRVNNLHTLEHLREEFVDQRELITDLMAIVGQGGLVSDVELRWGPPENSIDQ